MAAILSRGRWVNLQYTHTKTYTGFHCILYFFFVVILLFSADPCYLYPEHLQLFSWNCPLHIHISYGIWHYFWVPSSIHTTFSKLQCCRYLNVNDMMNMAQIEQYWQQLNTIKCKLCACFMMLIKWKHFPHYWPIVGGTTSNRWIPLTKASDTELWCFLWSAIEQMIEQTIKIPVIWDTIILIMMPL